jgi:hypothetical protein
MKLTPLLTLCPLLVLAAPAEPKFRLQEIDKVSIGYGLAIADVNGDGKPDILLADQHTVQWYQNPTWQKHVIAENLTKLDHVCIAAQVIDGKCEVAVGAGWNPSDTVNSGAVFYLKAPADPTQKWEAIELPHEPTVHRMQWVQVDAKRWDLVVQPLHGRANKNTSGIGAKMIAYEKPADPKQPWKLTVVNEVGHVTHNLQPTRWSNGPAQEILSGSKEGIWLNAFKNGAWTNTALTNVPTGELRDGKLPNGQRFLATVEPFHGTMSAVYTQDADGKWTRQQLLDGFKEGHAVAVADFLGTGSDQYVVGWRGTEPGIRLLTPLDPAGKAWRTSTLTTKEIAVEDFKAADLNGDGKPDLIVAGRQTKNLLILWNDR